MITKLEIRPHKSLCNTSGICTKTIHTVKHPNKLDVIPERPNLIKIDQANFYSFLEDNKTKLTVIDFYSQMCAPCKQSKPKFEKWADDYINSAFAEMEYTFDNRQFLRGMGIMQVPTFQVYRDGEKILEIIGNRQLKEIEDMLRSQEI
jgi:thioredoxin 1